MKKWLHNKILLRQFCILAILFVLFIVVLHGKIAAARLDNNDDLYNDRIVSMAAGDLVLSDEEEDYSDITEYLTDFTIRVKKPRHKGTRVSLREPGPGGLRRLKLEITGLKDKELVEEDVLIVNHENKNLCKKISYLSDSHAVIQVSLDSIYICRLFQDNNFYYILLDKPKERFPYVVVLDAGHGGNDAGTCSADMETKEKDINLSILLELKKLLDKEPDIKVYYTRLTDKKVRLKERIRTANDTEADLFISIHCNASDSAESNGTEVLFSPFRESSAFFAQDTMAEVASAIKTRERSIVPGDDKYVLGHAKVPAVIIETAYLTNNKECKKLRQKKIHQKTAKAIHKSIIEYLYT